MSMDSVLVRAAWHGDVSLLLTELAVVTANDDDVNEALLIAACLGHIQCVTALLKRGADPDCSDVDGDTPLMLAIANNFVEVVSVLVMTGCDINQRNVRSRTALHTAVWNRRPRLVRMLLDEPCCEIDAKDYHGDTPMMLCAKRGYADILQMLVNAGCNVNESSGDSNTALHYASRQGNVDCVAVLVEHRPPSSAAAPDAAPVDLEARTSWGLSALMLAVTSGESSNETATTLLEAGASVNARDPNGRTALHYASLYNGSSPLVRRMLELGADPDIADDDGCVPLVEAVTSGCDRVLSTLVRYGCRPDGVVGRVTLSEYRQATPLEIAVYKGSLQSARLLYEVGCEFSDFVGPLSVSHVGDASVRDWLSTVVSQPRPLAAVARIVLRKSLGLGLRHRLSSLSLPSVLAGYVLLDDLNSHWQEAKG